MTNPTVTLTRFATRKLTAKPAKRDTAPIRGDFDTRPLENLLQAAIDHAREYPARQPRYWSFSEWGANHSRDEWQGATAVVLEYSAELGMVLLDRVRALPWFSLFVTTQSSEDDHVAVVFPVREPITTSESYTRVASLLAKEIDLMSLREGSTSCTFFIKPGLGSLVGENDGTVLDPGAYLAKHKGVWVKAEDYEGKPGYGPAATAQLTPPSVTSVHVDDLDPELFSFGGGQ